MDLYFYAIGNYWLRMEYTTVQRFVGREQKCKTIIIISSPNRPFVTLNNYVLWTMSEIPYLVSCGDGYNL